MIVCRYRWRTRLREGLPLRFAHNIPKGAKDCGCHEWYRHSAEEDYCYHCFVSLRKPSQLTRYAGMDIDDIKSSLLEGEVADRGGDDPEEWGQTNT